MYDLKTVTADAWLEKTKQALDGNRGDSREIYCSSSDDS